jgi:hypothetical protein
MLAGSNTHPFDAIAVRRNPLTIAPIHGVNDERRRPSTRVRGIIQKTTKSATPSAAEIGLFPEPVALHDAGLRRAAGSLRGVAWKRIRVDVFADADKSPVFAALDVGDSSDPAHRYAYQLDMLQAVDGYFKSNVDRR